MPGNTELTNAEGIDLSDVGTIIKRRAVALSLPFLIVLTASVVIAYALPPVYRSEATILVEGEEIPAEFVETTVTGYVQQRIQEIRQRILTRARLLEIADTIGFIASLSSETEDGDIVRLMRESTQVAMVDVKATGGSGRVSTITIAFTVAFEANKPEVARAGARQIADLFLEENRKLREEQVAQVSEFLAIEADRLEQQVLGLEDQLAKFKEKHLNELPEHASLNMRLVAQTESQIERTELKIRSLEDRKLNLESQISTTDPYKEVFTDTGRRVQTGLERLSVLLAEYSSKSSLYSQDHPDIVRLRREIQSLDTQTGGVTEAGRILSELTAAREALSTAQQKYSDAHPDVKKLQKTVDSLDRELSEISIAPGITTAQVEEKPKPVAPDNPTYIRLQTQLDAVNADIVAENKQIGNLSAKLIEYEERLSRSPGVERDFLAISKDYESAKSKYQEIRNNQLKAELAEQLERDEKAGRFTLVDPANLPDFPDRPNRLGIVLIGFMLATISGVGTAGIFEFNDTSVRGSKGIVALFNEPPLAVIPYIENAQDKSKSRVRRLLYALMLLAIVGVGGAAVIFFGQSEAEAATGSVPSDVASTR